jgi:hypothetical protein
MTVYIMSGGNEQRVVIVFFFKAGLSTTETLVLVHKTYENEAGIRYGRELVDDERDDHPLSARSEVNIVAVAVAVAELVKKNL